MKVAQSNQVQVWDGATRLWHWSIVLLMIFLWYSAEIADDLMDWHMRAGRLLLGLIVFRIVWGFIGSDTSRFANFIKSPAEIIHYLKNKSQHSHAEQIGHNPAGGIMVLVLIAGLIVQATTGLFTSDGYFYGGPFADSIDADLGELFTNIHHIGFKLLLALVAIHILAIIAYLVKRDNLVRPMVTGKKTLSIPAEVAPRLKSPVLAFVSAVICVGAIWFITT